MAAAMLRRGWMIRYITPSVRQNVSEATMVAAGYAWAALVAARGLGAVGARVAGVALQLCRLPHDCAPPVRPVNNVTLIPPRADDHRWLNPLLWAKP